MFLLMVVLASCEQTGVPGSTGSTGPSEDSELAAVAGALQAELEAQFPQSYAGVRLAHDRRAVVVYRLPDAGLDAAVRSRYMPVPVEIVNASFSLDQMKNAVARIVDDQGYWRGRGLTVNGAAPTTDGTGVLVFIAEENPGAEGLLRRHYPAMPITVQVGRAQFPIWRGSIPPVRVS